MAPAEQVAARPCVPLENLNLAEMVSSSMSLLSGAEAPGDVVKRGVDDGERQDGGLIDLILAHDDEPVQLNLI